MQNHVYLTTKLQLKFPLDSPPRQNKKWKQEQSLFVSLLSANVKKSKQIAPSFTCIITNLLSRVANKMVILIDLPFFH